MGIWAPNMFIKKLQRLLLFLFFVSDAFVPCYAQKIGTFQKSFGTKNDEYGASVLELPDKGFLLAGITVVKGSNPPNNPGSYYILIIRTDSLGRQIWSKTYTGNNQGLWLTTDFFAAVKLDMTPDGDVAVFTSAAGNGFGLSEPGHSYLFKIDLNGNVNWSQSYDNYGGGLAATTVINQSDGGYLMLAVGELDWLVRTRYSQRVTTLIKTNDTGGVEWSYFYFHQNYRVSEIPYNMTISKKGGYLVSGYEQYDTNAATIGFFIKKIDGSGALVWSKNFSNSANYTVNPYSIIELPDGSIYACGNYDGLPILIKFNSSGQLLWAKIYKSSGTSSGKFMSVFYENAKNVFDLSFSAVSNSYQRIGMMRLDTSGKILFDRVYGPVPKSSGYPTSFGNDFIQLRNGGYALLQSTGETGAGGVDFYFVKTDKQGKTDSCHTDSLSFTSSTVSFTNYSFADTSFLSRTDIGKGGTPATIAIKDSVVCPPFVPNFVWQYGCAGQSIQFFDSTYYKPVSWVWNFGDGTSGTVQNPSHQYLKNGTYHVTLFVSNGKDTATVVKAIIVNETPPPFKSDTFICTGDSILLDARTKGSQYFWNDNSTGESNNVTIGTYWVRITSGSCVVTDTVHVMPINSIKIKFGNDTTICNGTTITLHAGTPDAFWSTGAYGPTISVSKAGTYSAALQGNSCSVSDTIVIRIANPILPDLGGNQSVCKDSIVLNPGFDSGATYLWSTGDTTQKLMVKNSGRYSIKTTKNGCSAFDTAFIVISSLKGKNTLPRDTFLCEGAALLVDLSSRAASSVIWNDNFIGRQRTITKSGLYVMALSTPSCKETDTMNVVFDTTHIDIGTSLCQKPYYLYAPLPWINGTYLWSTGSKSSVIYPTSSGTYWLRQQQSTCPVFDTVAISLDSLPSIKLDSVKKVCDSSIVLNPGQNLGSAYLWSNGDTSQTILVDKSGKYWVMVTNKNGCSVSDTSLVMLLAPVLFGDNNLKDSTFCSDKGPLVLDAGPASKYYWSPSNDTTEKIAITDSGKYTVQITGTDGCTADKSFTITDYCTPSLFVPNSFSPDGNSDNDIFLAYGVNIASFSMRIYNRWGERLFSSNNLDKGWDGRFRDNYCATGIYIYIIEYSTWVSPSTPIKKAGTIYLKR